MSIPQNLTEKTIRTALESSPDGLELRLHDKKVPGLLLWRRPNGKARWYVFKRVAGRIQRMPVGEVSDLESIPLDTARDLARTLIGRLAGGVDVTAERAAKRASAAETRRGGVAPLADALAIHLKELSRRGRDGGHVRELERVVTAAVAAGVKDLADKGIAAKARLWLDSLDVSEPTRHRYRVHLLAVVKTALANWPPEALPRDPFLALRGKGAGLPAPAVFDPAESVTLVGDQALALPGGRLFAFLLLTGCRFKEATWARWDRINLDRSVFYVVPPDAAERAAGARVKRDKPRTVHLIDDLVALLREWQSTAHPADPFLFPAEWRSRPHVHNVLAFRAHLASLGIPLNNRRIHTLRHTRQTLGIAAGEDSMQLRLSMGHAGEDMGAHYGRLAMRWRGLLATWNGILRLRDPAEAARLGMALHAQPSLPTTATTAS